MLSYNYVQAKRLVAYEYMDNIFYEYDKNKKIDDDKTNDVKEEPKKETEQPSSNVPKREYKYQYVGYLEIPKINLKEYEDVTASFNEVFTPVAGKSNVVNEDIRKKSTNQLVLNSKIDFNLLISSIPKSMVSEKCFQEEIKELIDSLAYTYNIDDPDDKHSEKPYAVRAQ